MDLAGIVNSFVNPADDGSNQETRVSLRIDGTDYKTWKSVSISRSMVSISGSFEFVVSNKYAGNNSQWRIFMGSNCEVVVGGKTVITGYIDSAEVSYDANNYNISFSGRDKTADLVDCCYDITTLGGNELKNLVWLQIIEKLCSPFGISVDYDTSLAGELAKVKENFTIEPGEKVFETISDICKQLGILPMTYGDSKLYLARAGTEPVTDKLEGGVNVKSAKLSLSDENRYSDYVVVGQKTKASAFSPESWPFASLTDSNIERYKPLLISVGKSSQDGDLCLRRCAWEARIREGQSRKIDVIVRNWLQSDGTPWPINGLVRYKDKYIGVDDNYVIAKIEMSLDDSAGEITKMMLVHPDTFTMLKSDIKKRAKTAFDKKRAETQTDIASIRDRFGLA